MKIGVLGAGTWGMALARMLANENHDVEVYSAIESEIDELSTTRRQKNLPGMVIPDSIRFTKNIEEACKAKDIILCAVPSIFVRSTMEKAKNYIPEGQIIVDVAKGIESSTLFTMSEIIEDVLGNNMRVVALSGPTHAEEVAKDMPTTIVSASKDLEAAKIVQDAFMNDNMRVYTNEDIKGVEICGALKNVIALASGISSGLGFGDNARAALITRGIAEMMRLGKAMDCNIHTFSGLAGIGDLIVTATSMHSRNNRCGQLIGQGVKADEAIRQVGMVVEGINALPAAMELKEKYNVELPIIETVNDIINNGADPKRSVYDLMNREKKDEIEF
ncbi:MAG: NAD(P)-dependent glycerol-3-phosphate dehydrogenase [Solobacterium sp.]|nr:NAD(P)-dependent glycerol-3-phosphate dehydrogenase [Solobacterium sp.]